MIIKKNPIYTLLKLRLEEKKFSFHKLYVDMINILDILG